MGFPIKCDYLYHPAAPEAVAFYIYNVRVYCVLSIRKSHKCINKIIHRTYFDVQINISATCKHIAIRIMSSKCAVGRFRIAFVSCKMFLFFSFIENCNKLYVKRRIFYRCLEISIILCIIVLLERVKYNMTINNYNSCT